MEPMHLLFVGMLIGGLAYSKQVRELVEKLAEGLNSFRGGPPPTHPSPAADGFLLNRRRSKRFHFPVD